MNVVIDDAAAARRLALSRLLQERQAGMIPRAPRDEPLPLSFAQRRLWFLDQLGLAGSGYTIPFVIELEGPLDIQALNQALDALVQRHEVLRSRFLAVDGEPFQQPGPAYGLALAPQDADAETSAAAALAFANIPIELKTGRLLQAALWRLQPERHKLALAVHHIAFDGWSIDLLGRELSSLYSDFAAGRPSSLPPLDIQYADFARWQHDPARLAAQEERLVQQARRIAALPPFSLRGDRQPGHTPSQRQRPGRIHRFALSAGLTARLTALGQEQGATAFNMLLTGFLLLLARREAMRQPVVGCPIAGRDGLQTEALLGFFVNSIVVSAPLDGGMSFLDALARVKAAVADAIGTQDIPFERLIERAQPDRLFSRNPIFEVMFAWQAPFRFPDFSPTLRVADFQIAETSARFDLECHVWRDGDRIHGGLIHDASRFDAETISIMADQLTLLLEGAVNDPRRRVAAIVLGSAGSEPSVLPTRDTAQGSLAELFARSVTRDPHAIAVSDGDRILTYAALDGRANALAHWLLAAGVGIEEPVAMLLPRSLESIVATLGIAKAGATLLPLDPAWPEARRRDAMALNGARLTLDTDTPLTATNALPPAPRAAPQNLAYVTFTSGSTGIPKCIGVAHAAVARLVLDTDFLQVGPTDRVAHLASPAFDAATFEIWGPLLNGGSILVIAAADVPDPAVLARRLSEGRATIAFLTTALMHRAADMVPDGFSGLRCLLFGGELCDPARVGRLLGASGPKQLLHVYGPTETTTFASWHAVEAIVADAAIPIGRAIRNDSLHVQEAGTDRIDAAPGVAGELLIGGAGIARGYLGAPGQTADRFRPDPWGAPGSRLYRTGDLARHRPDGSVDFLGRIDRQVKIRGFRIEPGEIEAIVRSHPMVADAAVQTEEHPAGRRLVAYVVPAVAAPEFDTAMLRALLVERLPDWMIPAAIHVIDHVPLTSAGKTDAAGLRAMVREMDATPARPMDGTETIIAALMTELLGVTHPGPDTDFFAAGGHSLLATTLIMRIGKLTGIRPPLDQVLRTPTVAGIAEVVRRLNDDFETGEI